MLCGDFSESICKEIKLNDVDAEQLLKLLQFACGKAGLVAENVEEVLDLGGLADRLQMESVRNILEDKLLKELRVENCLDLIQKSEFSGLGRLQKGCYKMLRDEFQVFTQKEGFLKLSGEILGNLLEEDALGTSREEDVFEALVKWMSHNDDDKQGQELLKKIRYGVIGDGYLAVHMSSALLPEHELVKELLGETMAKKGKSKDEGLWDGVERLSGKWTFARSWIMGVYVLKDPGYVAIDVQGRIIVSDAELHQIIVFNLDGTVAQRIGSIGKAIGQFYRPKGVAVNREGSIVVADSGNHRIQVLNADGSILRWFGSQGMKVGQLDSPQGVAIDRKGHIVVADCGNDRIQVFDAAGSVVRYFGSRGAAIGQLIEPMGVAADWAGHIVVTEDSNRRVQMFNADGSVALCFDSDSEEPLFPHGVAVESVGRFVVPDTYNARVVVFNSDGSMERVIGVGELRWPCGVAVDGTGRIIVVEADEDDDLHQVRVF